MKGAVNMLPPETKNKNIKEKEIERFLERLAEILLMQVEIENTKELSVPEIN